MSGAARRPGPDPGRPVLVVAFGTRGDVLPSLAVARELAARGVRVRVAVPSDFVAAVRRGGLEPVDLGVGAAAMLGSAVGRRWVTESGSGPRQAVTLLRAMFDAFGPAVARVLRREHRTGEAVASGLMTLGIGQALAEWRGVPHVQLLLAPLTPSRLPACAATPLLARPSRLNEAAGALGLHALAWASAPVVDAFRAELRLPARRRRAHVAVWRSTPTVYGVSRHVAPRDPAWPATVHVTGSWFHDEPFEPPDDVARFVADAAPVYLGFGSMLGGIDRDVARRVAVDAARLAGVPAVIAMGEPSPGERVDPGVRHVLEVDHAWLFPRVRAVVHHGGAGTTAQALRAGVPSVVVPMVGDQPYWARRLHELGAGAPPVPAKGLTADALAHAIRAVVGDPAMAERARHLARQMAGEGGAAEAADLLAEVLR